MIEIIRIDHYTTHRVMLSASHKEVVAVNKWLVDNGFSSCSWTGEDGHYCSDVFGKIQLEGVMNAIAALCANEHEAAS